MRGNHRRRGTRAVSPPGKTYDDALAVLDHVAVHTAGVTRTVLEAASHNGEVTHPGPQITGPYADFLRHTGRAIGLYGQTRFAGTGTEGSVDGELREAVEELRHSLDELHRRLPGTVRDDPDALATHGALRAQARRLAYQLVPD
ncbi:hypothetical protein QFZ66_000078 [Streptomyces sp. B4I13]|nr:hypothetical protein [Streptomyces sp. B4I13]MDQ0956200.1 hypothetical protein [Streptomyces sp. B4I13]